MPKVSVIIPVYNTAPYLERCLDSVCGQTLDDIEIICVNDGSPDDSHGILEKYAARDSRITYICFERNQGVATARNAGMAAATGTYIGFVDSDDTIAPDFYEKLFMQTEATEAEIVRGGLKMFAVDGAVTVVVLAPKTQEDKKHFPGYFSTAIYKAEFLRSHGITFPRAIRGQDTAFRLKALAVAQEIVFVEDAFYLYHRRPDSSDSEILPLPKVSALIECCDDVSSFLQDQNITSQTYVQILAECLFHCSMQTSRVPTMDREKATRLCTQKVIDLYAECQEKELLKKQLLAQGPLTSGLHRLLEANDTDGLFSWMQSTPTQKLHAQLMVKRRAALSAPSGEKS